MMCKRKDCTECKLWSCTYFPEGESRRLLLEETESDSYEQDPEYLNLIGFGES